MRFTQVLINLVKNSMKFCTNGIVQVYSAYNKDKNIMTVSVIDTGHGFQIDDNKEPFGSGMGLIICKSLVKANEGSFEIHSDGIGMGCTVRFTMKMQIPSEEEIENIKQTGKLYGGLTHRLGDIFAHY